MTYLKKVKFFFLPILLAVLGYSTIYPAIQFVSKTQDNITISASWDNQSCLGSPISITYTIVSTGNQILDTDFHFRGFVPGVAGLSCPSVQPPLGGFVAFDPSAAVPADCGGSGGFICADGTPNFGDWDLQEPFPQNIIFSMIVTVTATQCGTLSFTPCFSYVEGGDAAAQCLGQIAIFVSPVAQLDDVVAGPVCQGSVLTGTLPAPICTAQQGYTGPSGCSACAGCLSCIGFTGPCGGQTFHYTVFGATGGSVALSDPTGGVYQFTTDPLFFGTAAFTYNVVSDFQPLAFCSATAPGNVDITVKQSPAATPTEFFACAGQFSTGNLAPFVTGASGAVFSFGLNDTSCPGLTLSPSGIYSFTAPTGPGACGITYSVTDINPPPCSASGFASITILEAPNPLNQTIDTCVDTPVAGQLTATGGGGGYTFALTGIPFGGTAMVNPDGSFTFTPTCIPTCLAGCTGSFTFSVTDANGCTSLADGTVTVNVNTPPIPGTGQLTGCQNVVVTGNLLNFITCGTGPFIFGQVGGAVGASAVTVNPDGTFSFFPSFNFTGVGSFNFNVTGDSCSPSGVGTIFINYLAAPQVTGSTFNTCPGVTVTGDLNNNLLTPPGINISFTSVGAPSNGTLTLNPSGPFSFTPTPPTFTGSAGFNFQAVDSNLPCPSNVARINVIVHPTPTVAPALLSVCDNSVLNGNLQLFVQGEAPFTFVQDGAAVNGNLALDSGGAFTFAPTVFGPAAGGFNYIVSSNFGCTSPGAVNIAINPSPTATTGANIACGGVPVTGALAGLVSGGTPPYFFSIVSQTNGVASVGVLNGVYTFTPNNGVTSGSFVYRASDQNSCSATSSIDISVNPGPQASNGAFTACLGVTSFDGSLTGLVTGGSGTLIYTQTGPMPACGSVTVNPDGTFTFNPNPGFVGSCIFQYQVTDSGTPSCFDVGTVTFTVDESPFASGASFNACQDTLFTGNLNGFVSGGLPPFNFFQTGVAPVCGTVNVATGGTFTFQPAPAFVGPCTFNWFVVDSTPCPSNIANATIDVHPAPVAADTGPVGITGPNNICENTKASGNLNDLMSVGTPPYVFNAFNSINGSVALNPAGPYTFNPTPNFTGPASFQFRGRDSFGCLSNTGTVNINVNDSPTLTAEDPVFTCQNTPVTNQVFASGGTPPYEFSVVTVTHGSCIIDADTGIYIFTPDLNFSGNAEIVFRVDDSLGCSAQIEVTVVVAPAPVASSTSVQSCQQTVFGSLTGLVSGGTPPFTFSQTGPITCGDVTINPNGTFVYTGPAGFTGPCTFDFVVTDNTPSACFATGSVTISQSATGAPIASDGFACACFNTPVSGNLSNFVSGGIPPYVYMIVGTPVGGTVIINPLTGFFIFKPTPGFTGFASFQYIAKDSSNIFCQSNIATVTIQVPCCPFTGLTAPTGIIPG